jgi:hypothetical protein
MKYIYTAYSSDKQEKPILYLGYFLLGLFLLAILI